MTFSEGHGAAGSSSQPYPGETEAQGRLCHPGKGKLRHEAGQGLSSFSARWQPPWPHGTSSLRSANSCRTPPAIPSAVGAQHWADWVMGTLCLLPVSLGVRRDALQGVQQLLILVLVGGDMLKVTGQGAAHSGEGTVLAQGPGKGYQ